MPEDHPGGIFWYHPHRHGGVAQQVRAGMAGMIVVRGEIDGCRKSRAAKEQIMVLQAIELGDDFQVLDPIPDPTTEEAFFPRTQILYPINGVLTRRSRCIRARSSGGGCSTRPKASSCRCGSRTTTSTCSPGTA